MLIGLKPEEIESLPTNEKKLEAYKVVYKAFWDARMDSAKVSQRTDKQYRDRIKQLQDEISELEWKLVVV